MDPSTEAVVSEEAKVEVIPPEPGSPYKMAKLVYTADELEQSTRETAAAAKLSKSDSPPSEKAPEFSEAKECSVIEMPAADPPVAAADPPVATADPDSERIPLLSGVRIEYVRPPSGGSTYSNMSQQCLPCAQTACCSWVRRCAAIFSSPFCLPLYFMALSLPLAVGYMGVRYMTSCPDGNSLPILSFLIGLCGVLGLLSKIVEGFNSCIYPEFPPWALPVYIYFFTLSTMVLLLLAQMMMVLTLNPNFEEIQSKNYCDQRFFEFTYYASTGGFFLVSSCFGLFLPTITCLENGNGH